MKKQKETHTKNYVQTTKKCEQIDGMLVIF